MAFDFTGNALGTLLASATIPPLPSNPTPAQVAAYEAAVAQWIEISKVILTYVSSNGVVTVSASGILDGYGRACTGSGSGSIK